MTKKKTAAPARQKAVSTALAKVDPTTPLGIIERIVKDKSVDVGKLERVIEMQKDLMKLQAKAAFDAAFVAMAPELPTITKRGKILNKDKSTRSHYARLGEDIQPVIKPILERHGFAIRHKTEWPGAGAVRVIGILKHRDGHEETSSFEAPADTSEYRTHVQSLGSTVSYGRRYTTVDLLELTVQGVDDDGQKAPPTRQAPRQEARGAGGGGRPDIPVEPSHGSHAAQGEPITEKQVRRFWVIVRNSGRTDLEVESWLKRRWKLDSSKKIRRDDYDRICAAIEATADLPEAD